MALAISIVTESLDRHVFAMDGEPTPREITRMVISRMGDESEYIDDYSFDSTYELSLDLIREINEII